MYTYITVPTMLTPRDGTRPLLANLFSHLGVQLLSDVRADRIRRKRDRRDGVRVLCDQGTFALVPSREELSGRCGTD